MSFAVVILSKTIANLGPCVEAVRRHEPTVRIIVVDDGLEEVPDGVEIIRGIKPFVFSRNANLGIIAAGSDDVVLLNDDALLTTPGGFTMLASTAREHPQYGILSPTCNVIGNRNQMPSGRPGLRDEQRILAFVCAFIPRRVLNHVGQLDERFTAYGWEDNDYCRRVLGFGYKLGVVEEVYLDHGSLRSTFRGAATAAGDIRAGRQIYAAKWGDVQ